MCVQSISVPVAEGRFFGYWAQQSSIMHRIPPGHSGGMGGLSPCGALKVLHWLHLQLYLGVGVAVDVAEEEDAHQSQLVRSET